MTEDIWAPDPYIVALTLSGFLIALVAWLPLALKRLPLSLPIVCIGIGIVIFSLPIITGQRGSSRLSYLPPPQS
jgi:sodium/hydrogen antiporter